MVAPLSLSLLQFSIFSYKFNSHSSYKNAVLHLSPLYPLFDLKPSGKDVHRTLKLQGVNRGSTCGETERSHQSKNNCISQQRSGKEYVVLLSGAPFALKRGGRSVTEILRVHLACHLYSNCPPFCHLDYARRGHANEELEIGCLKVKSRKHQSLSGYVEQFP